MRPCPRCDRVFAEVRGAPEQACPYCGHVFPTPPGRAGAPPRSTPVDPVAALGLAWRTARRRYPLLLLAWAPLVLADFATAWLVERTVPAGAALDTLPELLRVLGIVLPAALAAGALELAGWSLVAGAAFGSARATLRRIGALLALGLLMTFTLLAGFLLAVIPFLVFLHWFLYAPAALAEGRTVGQAFEASRAFAKARRTYGFTALVVLAYVAYALVAWSLGAALAAPLHAAGLSREAATALGGALAAWPLAPLVPLLPAAYWRLASAAPEGSAPAAPAEAPPPPRPTTKCPRCGTLIPFERTGQPVDVACPACGARGRVL